MRLLVLPEDQAKPWPRWVERVAKPPLFALARRLNTWISRGDGSDAVHSQRTRELGLGLEANLHQAHRRPIPLARALSEGLERASAAIHGAWSRTGVLVRAGLGIFVIAFLMVCAAAPLTPNEQLRMLGAMWCLTLVIRKLPGPIPGHIMMTFSILASSRYIWWRLTQTLDLDSGIEMFLGGG